MPSTSIKQQRLMGMAYAFAKGEMEDAPASVKKLANSFLSRGKKKGIKKLKDFASTTHKNLPLKVSENRILRFGQLLEKLDKPILFNLLGQSEYVQKFDYIWSPNLSAGAPILYVNGLSEAEFFDEGVDLFDLIEGLWPQGKEDYQNWKKLYYGLVYGYVIKDKNSQVKILIQMTRFKGGFDLYINPNYRGQSEGEKIFIGDEIVSVFGPAETTYLDSDFSKLGLELEAKTKTIEDVKDMFYYLDALV